MKTCIPKSITRPQNSLRMYDKPLLYACMCMAVGLCVSGSKLFFILFHHDTGGERKIENIFRTLDYRLFLW